MYMSKNWNIKRFINTKYKRLKKIIHKKSPLLQK